MCALIFLGMEAIPTQSSAQAEVFTLEDMQASPQKDKYIPPRVKVEKSFDLTTNHNVKWFMDTYDYEGNYQGDLHLYVGEEGKKYGDMGIVVNAKEDVNDEATPCITITMVPKGETTKAKNISLVLEKWAPFDMTGSKEGKEKSFAKLGMNISSFSNVQESGVENYSQLVKGMRNAKGILSLGKKTTGKRQAKTSTQQKAAKQSHGRQIVRSAIAHMSGGDTTSSSKVMSLKVSSGKEQKSSTQEADKLKAQGTSHHKDAMPQDKGVNVQARMQQKGPSTPKELPKKNQISRGKRSVSFEVNDQVKLKRQKTDLIADSPQEVEIVGPSLQMDENKALALLETKKAYYPFGSDSTFSIDVLSCFPAPANYVYRKLNKDWVKILTHDLIEDTKFEEILAIVMPFDPDSQLPLQVFTKEDIPHAKYWIISGQHSISAAKRLQKSTLPKVTPQLQQQFRYRKSKVLLNCPPKVSREISKDANISVAKSMQEEPFLDQLLQARSQWIANGRPNKPPPGVNISKKSSKSWEVMIFYSITFLFLCFLLPFVRFCFEL